MARNVNALVASLLLLTLHATGFTSTSCKFTRTKCFFCVEFDVPINVTMIQVAFQKPIAIWNKKTVTNSKWRLDYGVWRTRRWWLVVFYHRQLFSFWFRFGTVCAFSQLLKWKMLFLSQKFAIEKGRRI